MEQAREQFDHEAAQPRQAGRSRALWIAVAAGLFTLAWLAAPAQNKSRRHADRQQERRNPLHFFLAGNYPRRRSIDRSGARPLFERRQSVYDAY